MDLNGLRAVGAGGVAFSSRASAATSPQLLAGDRRTLGQRFELGPGDLRMDAAADKEAAESRYLDCVTLAAGLEELREAHAGQTVVLVSHAIVARVIVLAALGLGLDRLWTVDATPAGLADASPRIRS